MPATTSSADLPLRPRVHGDGRAVGGELLGDGAADTAAAAGHERNFAFKGLGHGSLLLSVGGEAGGSGLPRFRSRRTLNLGFKFPSPRTLCPAATKRDIGGEFNSSRVSNY